VIAVARAWCAHALRSSAKTTPAHIQAALEAIGCGRVMLDSSGAIRQVNQKLCELAGKPEED